MDQRAITQFGHNPLEQFKQNWTVERLEQRFAAEDAQISAFSYSEQEKGLNDKEKHDLGNVEQMLKGTHPRNILISFDGKPPRTLEELAKQPRPKKQKKAPKERGDER